MKKKLSVMLLALICCIALFGIAGCKEDPVENVQIQLNQTAIELVVGETKELSASVQPADVKDKNIEWKSENDSIAVVSDGIVTAKAAGTTTITATTNGKTASCEVTVKDEGGAEEKPEETPEEVPGDGADLIEEPEDKPEESEESEGEAQTRSQKKSK